MYVVAHDMSFETGVPKTAVHCAKNVCAAEHAKRDVCPYIPNRPCDAKCCGSPVLTRCCALWLTGGSVLQLQHVGHFSLVVI
eukprot:11767275-Alexandrium_andersonii.AAC.1